MAIETLLVLVFAVFAVPVAYLVSLGIIEARRWQLARHYRRMYRSYTDA